MAVETKKSERVQAILYSKYTGFGVEFTLVMREECAKDGHQALGCVTSWVELPFHRNEDGQRKFNVEMK